jgi:hypothetical protein
LINSKYVHEFLVKYLEVLHYQLSLSPQDSLILRKRL